MTNNTNLYKYVQPVRGRSFPHRPPYESATDGNAIFYNKPDPTHVDIHYNSGAQVTAVTNVGTWSRKSTRVVRPHGAENFTALAIPL